MSRRWRAIVWLGPLFALLVTALLAPGEAAANGGQIRIGDTRIGPYNVTVYTSPSPLRVGLIDISMLVQKPDQNDIVTDARVWVTLTPINHPGTGGTYEATHGQATTTGFYAANITVKTQGKWRMAVKVTGPAGEGTADFTATVNPPGLFAGRSWMLWLGGAIIGVGIIWWLFFSDNDDEGDQDNVEGDSQVETTMMATDVTSSEPPEPSA